MKYLIGAIALIIAAPAAAQTAPVAQHQSHDSMQHQQGQAEHDQHQPGHQEGHGAMDGCCQDRNGNGRMDCCEDMPPGERCCCEHEGQGQGEQGHQGH
jgi:hypothetical protein